MEGGGDGAGGGSGNGVAAMEEEDGGGEGGSAGEAANGDATVGQAVAGVQCPVGLTAAAMQHQAHSDAMRTALLRLNQRNGASSIELRMRGAHRTRIARASHAHRTRIAPPAPVHTSLSLLHGCVRSRVYSISRGRH